MVQVTFHHVWPGFRDPAPKEWTDFFETLCQDAMRGTRFTEIRLYGIHPSQPPAPGSVPPNALTLHFTGEPCFMHPRDGVYHVYLVPARPETPGNDRVVVFSQSHLNILLEPGMHARMSAPRATPPTLPPRFACAVVSNGSFPHRADLIRRLHGMAHATGREVDSAGEHANTVGYCAPRHGPDYLAWIGQYRWMLAMENTDQPYYITEKILHAWLGGAVPIYWGCKECIEVFNPDAFLWIPPDAGPEAVTAVFRRALAVDADPVAYAAMRARPLLRTPCPIYDAQDIARRVRDVVQRL